MKYKRYTVNAPLAIAEMIDERIPECPYKSDSDYFLGLAIFDCWSRRPHRYTALLLAQPAVVRDAAFLELAQQFKKGETKSSDPGWFDRFVERIISEELRKRGITDT